MPRALIKSSRLPVVWMSYHQSSVLGASVGRNCFSSRMSLLRLRLYECSFLSLDRLVIRQLGRSFRVGTRAWALSALA